MDVPAAFLQLPPELRNMVYDLVATACYLPLISAETVTTDVPSVTYRSCLHARGLFSVNHQIRHETERWRKDCFGPKAHPAEIRVVADVDCKTLLLGSWVAEAIAGAYAAYDDRLGEASGLEGYVKHADCFIAEIEQNTWAVGARPPPIARFFTKIDNTLLTKLYWTVMPQLHYRNRLNVRVNLTGFCLTDPNAITQLHLLLINVVAGDFMERRESDLNVSFIFQAGADQHQPLRDLLTLPGPPHIFPPDFLDAPYGYYENWLDILIGLGRPVKGPIRRFTARFA
ncbi:hypothetical protein HBH98_182850 [Parastagonospora nodorum]|nr:hypothetical protein HBH53_230900 [Parastagonospora nodorum]KAH3956682.1 hypothetical protein HBH51_237290 [Parastagonospora nodorum]KAH4215695.1 hypothetical protein HBI06_244060 [Parastagonospora nodorum]KAH4224451.1 hypothetical protein HBI05_236310 [Parastagonospora nodorum]KAH4341272.1 hypothetical protein HBH98_182850 [Parastagonospora nodorum]